MWDLGKKQREKGKRPRVNKFCNLCQTRKLGSSLLSWLSLTDFASFQVFNLILHVWFYESTCDFDNIGFSPSNKEEIDSYLVKFQDFKL